MSKTFDQYLSERYSEDEIKSIHTRAAKKSESYIAFKKSISGALKEHMVKNNIGFNEIKQELGTSDSQTSRILKGETNFTIKTIFKIAEAIGKYPRVIFD